MIHKKRRSISAVMVITCMIFLGMTAMTFAAQQSPTVQQQPAPLKAAPAPVRVTATLGVSPASYSGNCPALITFRGHITVNQPATVQYKFIRSDNAQAPVQTLNFPKAGTQEVSTTWQLGGPSLPTYSGWEAIQVISPVSVQSNKANFSIRCAGQGQQGGTVQPGTVGQQTGPQVQQVSPVRVKAELGVKPPSYTGNCPALISFRGFINVSQPTTVQYRFIRSDNAQAPVQTLNFPKAGTQEVSTTWQLGGPSLPTYSGWEAIEVISPVSVQSNKAEFRIRCTGEGQQGGTETEKQLPDLTIVDITLNDQCFVVVTAKNNGPGTLPDKVWTDHSPDSSAIYLYINGKKWGGQTIAGFDPAKNLQNPGGTATMTSRLKVTGTAIIGAIIDHTHRVKETDEQNNAMKKEVTCRIGAVVQPGVVTQLEKLPDLTVEDITLNQECLVVVTVKNNGPGSVPDKVWTDHAPDSSAVYLYINGKKWGGETIWHFDPAKNLQSPGGTATMTSNLKVAGTATIEAHIDLTQKVKETDEKNNGMKKGLTCKTSAVMQPGQQGIPIDVEARLSAKPASYTGNCPALITFGGYIAVNQPMTVQYRFIRSDNAQSPVQTLNFSSKSRQEVTTTWQLGGPSLPTYSGWEAIEVISPVSVQSNKAEFVVRCAGQGQPGQGGQPGPAGIGQPGGPTQPGGAQTGGAPQPMGREDCISFNPATTTVQQIQGTWKVVDGNHWIFDFGAKKGDADRTLAIIQHYRMNQVCFVGRPNPSFQYMLVSGASPVGSSAGEDCVSFNPATTTVQQVQGSWKVVDGNHWMFDFGANKAEADQTLAIIKKYGFTYSCFVGRPGPKFSYLRK